MLLNKFSSGLHRLFPWLARFDQFLLLNFPRLWLSRVHVVVVIAGAVFATLLAVTLGLIRPALVPSYTAMLNGPDWGCLGKTTSIEQIECALPSAFQELQSSVATSIILMDVMISIVAVLLALLWIKAQARYSVEAVHGKAYWYGAWFEWACYALCLGLIFGGGWVVRIGLMPSPTQMQSFERFRTRVYAGLDNYHLPRDMVMTIRTDPSPTRSAYPVRWILDVAPGGPEAAHLQQLADAAYAEALGARVVEPDLAYDRYEISLLTQFLPWLLIVGYGAYVVYVSKRQRWAHIFAAFLLINVVALVAFFFVVFIFGIIAGMGGRSEENIITGLLVGGVTFGLVVTGIQWTRALLIKRFSRNAALGTIAFPWVLAFVPIVLLAVSSLSWVKDWLGWEWKSQQQTNALTLAVAIAPYLFLPIMPLLDKALVRLGALPSER